MNEPTVKEVGIIDVRFGRNVTVVKPVNLYGCEIGDNTFVGPFVEIQKGARIGANCRIQSHVFICDMVEIDDDCFISHGVKFINDPFSIGDRARGRRELYRPTIIEKGVCIGTNATILPVRIATGVVIGAGSVVTRDLLKPGIYAGNPARLLRKPDSK